MKKLLSIVLSAVMVMAMFSGLVLFNTSAAETKLIHFDFINQYTNEQAAKMASEQEGTTASKSGDYVTITGSTSNDYGAQRIQIDTANADIASILKAGSHMQWFKNALIDGIDVFEGIDLSNKVGMGLKFGGTDAGKISKVSLCLGSSKKKVAIDLKDFAKNDDGYFYRAFSNCKVVGATWYYDCPTWQDTFYCTIDQCSITIYFSGVSEGTSVSLTFEDAYVEAYNDTDALAAAILEAEALGIDETSSRAVYFNCGDYTQAQIDAEVQKVNDDIAFATLQYVQLPGVQDWTATEMETYNTIAELEQDNFCGTPAELATDHVTGAATQSVKLIMGGKPKAWSVNFSTAASTDKAAAGTLGNVLGKYAKLSELFKFEGIRIAVQNEKGEKPSLVTWDKDNPHEVSLKLVGSGENSWNNKSYPTAQAKYYQDKQGGDIEPVYHDGYYYFYFKDLVSGWDGNFVEKYAANNWTYGNLFLHFQNGGLNNKSYNGGAIYVSDMQLFRKNNPTEELIEGLWKGNYTDESWAKVEAAIADNDPEAIQAAIAGLKVRATVASTEDFFEGWTSEQVNAVVNANSDKLCDNIGNSLNIEGEYDAGDFTKNTVFAADGNFSMTAKADFTKGTMGWKNMDRSGTLAEGGKNYGYPTFDPKGLATSEGIRFKLTATGGDAKGQAPKFERLLIGLSNCATAVDEMYALEIKPEYFNSQGYINIPFDVFVKPASWGAKFTSENIEDAVVVILQAYGVPNGVTLTFSDFTGYTTATADDLVKDIWQYNYTDESWAAVQAAIDAGGYAGTEAAIAALELRDTVAATEDFFKGWTNAAVNAVVGANAGYLCDNIGNSLNIEGEWDAGDFTNNTVFAANNNFSMTATADFTGKTMGWKNMDRSGTVATGAKYGYPTFDAKGLADAEGIRFKLSVSEGGSYGRLLIGLSNCATASDEMYALKIKPEYFTTDGYINIPFDVFVKPASWGAKFTSENIEDAVVVILQAYDVTNGTTLTFSDMAGYKAFKPASEDVVAKFNTYLANLEAFDIDDRYDNEIQAWKGINLETVDELEVEAAAADILAILKKYKDANTGIVDVPGYSIYTQEEMDQFVGRESTWKVTKTDRGATFARTSGKGYFVSNGTYGGNGYEEGDTNYGAVAAINGKTFIDMLGGFKLKDIQAFRFQSTGSAYYQFMFKDGVGLWNGLVTKGMNITKGADGYYTVNVSEIPTDQFDGWYGKWTLDDIINKTKFININPTGNLGKEVYGWQVVLFDTIDRSDLATAIAAFAAEGLVAEYSTEYGEALETYYDDAATQGDIDDAEHTLNKILNKPDAPSLGYDEITDSSITVTAVTGCEYQIDGGAWTDSNEFTGLDANTEYTIGIRVKATDDAIASDVTKNTWTTEKGSFGNASISVSGTERYLETLTASEEDVPDYLGNYEIEWRDNEGNVRGTGSSYTLTAADIGKTIVAVLVSENADDEVSSDPTGTIGKGIITGYTVPTASEITYPQALADSTLSGGDTGDITGDWAWADGTTRPHFDQSGNDFSVTFTPSGEYADWYEVVNDVVAVTINEPDYKLMTIKSESGFALTGSFVDGTEVGLKAITYKDAAYLSLLRASGKAESENSQLILFYDISLTYEGEELVDLYDGTLEVSSYVGIERAGETYDVWFFIDDAPICYKGIVDEAGYLKVGSFGLEKPVARIGNASYATFESALLSAGDGDTITLLQDCAMPGCVEVTKDITIDGDNYTLFGDENDASVNFVVNGATLTLKNITLDKFGYLVQTNSGIAVVKVNGDADPSTKVVAENVKVTRYCRTAFDIRSGELELDGCELDPANTNGNYLTKGVQIGYGANSVTASISNTTFKNCDTNYEDWACAAIEVYDNAEATIDNVKIVDCDTPIYVTSYSDACSATVTNSNIDVADCGISGANATLILNGTAYYEE